MRIVGGKYGSRVLKAPKDDAIRPTSDKLRGAIFNMLRSRGVLDGALAMDCFCGTGALGIEALSQGADTCVFVDNSRASFDLAKENAATLKIGSEAEFIFRDAARMGPRPPNVAARTLVFLDPPYRKNLVPQALESLSQGGWLAADAFCVIEAEKDFVSALPPGIAAVDEKFYGETKLILAIASSSSPE
ncbi:MAG: 16S rRNA (guanine(966)-N(2))-methyltransferase RsmD [Alphaproteobacteria bacterium]